MFPPARGFPEHARIVAERLHLIDGDLLEIGMLGIDQEVGFVHGQRGGDEQQTDHTSIRTIVSDLGQNRLNTLSTATA